jgi:hypothetical protein
MLVQSNCNQKLGIGSDLVMLLVMAIDIYYETTQSIAKEKNIKETIKPIITKKFKGKSFFIKKHDKDITNLVSITKVEISSFGVELFLKDNNKSIIISYDELILAIKNS